jgi:RimJ/RimL family protein N-acetyltransferase
MPNYLKLFIENENIQLSTIDISNTLDILKNNTGNVREFFIAFESQKEVESWILEQRQKMEIGKKIELSIFDKQTGNFVGMVSLDNLTDKDQVEPRIWISPEYQNKGYGKQSLQLLINWYKSQPTATTINYVADSHNEASKRLALSLGFEFQKQYIDEDGDNVTKFVL